MINKVNVNKFNELRKKHKAFIYEKFDVTINNGDLKIVFTFFLDDLKFTPELIIENNPILNFKKIKPELLNNIVFHIGMIELISYWKAACPKRLIIKPFYLDSEQVEWWKKLYYKGLGEFFYLNGIKVTEKDFMQIIVEGVKIAVPLPVETSSVYLVPVGGGKDSVVTLELLGRKNHIVPFVINPRKATDECIAAAGYSSDQKITVSRNIHEQLLELNRLGYLNGHTPFSAMLAFTSLLIATLSCVGNIALSNEASANEATILNTDINHQYSKSFDFESGFRKYVQAYITRDINYFSFLRPLHELQIAALFSRYRKYYKVFKSCNAGSKTDIWCCNCPKCLFAYIIMLPFINEKDLIDIFGENLLEKDSLIPFFDQLTGFYETKPFECIGTVEEVNLAICKYINDRSGSSNHSDLPLLVKRYFNSELFNKYKLYSFNNFLQSINPQHNLNASEQELIKNELLCF